MLRMDVDRSSLCNCVVNFLLEENYLLTAFELLHELLDDGRDAQAIRLKGFFSDSSQFPHDQISRLNSIRVADPQSLLEEKEALVEKLSLNEYELRLAREDIEKLKTELEKKSKPSSDELNGHKTETSVNSGSDPQQQTRETSSSDFGVLKDNERRDLNCAVKEYLLLAGYRLTAMTFYEDVTDQNLDVWQNSSACCTDALRHYYYQYLTSISEAAEEKISLLIENECVLKENEKIENELRSLQKYKDVSDAQVSALNKSLEALQTNLQDKEKLVQELKQALKHQRKNLNDCRAEITSLKMHNEGSLLAQKSVIGDTEDVQTHSVERYMEEISLLQKKIETLKATQSVPGEISRSIDGDQEINEKDNEVVKSNMSIIIKSSDDKGLDSPDFMDTPFSVDQRFDECGTCGTFNIPDQIPGVITASPLHDNDLTVKSGQVIENGGVLKPEILDAELVSQKMGMGTVQILSDALPKIVPYVLINHREELLPLIMCSIERHPDSQTRDSLTHTLFNLIKRPDEQQRKIIMDACVTLAKNVGEMRTETELLPQCWEQISHSYEERRLLVAQSCGELAEYVRPEIRDSLILSIMKQLIEDSTIVVREAAAHNLALLLPLFPNMDKYFKVEEIMFQLLCDPSGVVVEATIKQLVPALINWGNKLDHVLRVLVSHMLGSTQRCPPLSGVEGSLESHLHVLGERERWNVDVLLRLLFELLPFVKQRAIETCPFPTSSENSETIFTTSLLQLYASGQAEWSGFEWLHIDFFPAIIQLASLLPQKEDSLRTRLVKILLAVSEHFGDDYMAWFMIPVFSVAVGNDDDLTFFPSKIQPKIKGLRPKLSVAKKLATLCVLPLFLAGVLGYPNQREQLTEYLRTLLVQASSEQDGQYTKHLDGIFNSVRFLCTFEEHHTMVFNILWEMVASSNTDLKISAANTLKVVVPYVDSKVASTHVLPALVTLGSDPNLNVKFASIDAFGAVAQQFKNDVIVDKIRVQMDAFLEDGSHEAAIAVVRALVVAIPHTTDRLRDYLLSKIFQLTNAPFPMSDIMCRRDRANAFCESIRALDATDIPANSVRDFLLPAIQNLLKDPDALDPAHKEALEIIGKERSGGTFDSISKVMGSHLGLASSMTSLFGEGGLLGSSSSTNKKETTTDSQLAVTAAEAVELPKVSLQPPIIAAEDTRFRRIMRGSFTDMLKGKKAEEK
ncbi:RAB11-binding protein RELCH homolog [Impatiens glandulifera]|uniref:RAB11-binding protein RELCH homolog n=1 Tax=Impatiens glandulifera TaxID=253017 RepID=UPI001FB08BCE|nr:RAB11-binding protein RELCH homolog [Impatiens glandulifera]